MQDSRLLPNTLADGHRQHHLRMQLFQVDTNRIQLTGGVSQSGHEHTAGVPLRGGGRIMGGVCGRGGVLIGDGAPTDADPRTAFDMPAGSETGGALTAAAAEEDADEDARPDGRAYSDGTSCAGFVHGQGQGRG